LDARIHLDERRLVALWPETDVDVVRAAPGCDTAYLSRRTPGAGQLQSFRSASGFTGWFTASTIIQPFACAYGIRDNTGDLLDRLANQFLLA